MTDIESNKINNDNNNDTKILKTKDYVLRAMYKYRIKKYAEDEEFREQELARSREYYQKNKEKHSLYMKEYYARKKREKEQAKQITSGETTQPDIDTVANSIEQLSII
jgi:hypothetical protein